MAKEQVAITEWANGQVCQHKVSKFAEPAKITFVNSVRRARRRAKLECLGDLGPTKRRAARPPRVPTTKEADRSRKSMGL